MNTHAVKLLECSSDLWSTDCRVTLSELGRFSVILHLGCLRVMLSTHPPSFRSLGCCLLIKMLRPVCQWVASGSDGNILHSPSGQFVHVRVIFEIHLLAELCLSM